MTLFSWLTLSNRGRAEVRAEIWKLGARHLGRPLEGAIEELKRPGLSSERVALLRACVRTLKAR